MDVAAGTFGVKPWLGSIDAVNERSDETRSLMQEAQVGGLVSLPDGTADNGSRRSNDLFLVGEVQTTSLSFSVSPDGRALMNTQLAVVQDGFQAHFPKGLTLPPGTTNLTATASVLSGGMAPSVSQPAVLSYATSAADTPQCAIQNNPTDVTRSVSFLPNTNGWAITPDGGLRAEGTISSTDIAWGIRPSGGFTHRITNAQAGSVLMAGYHLASAAYPAVDEEGGGYLPVAMLLSGHGQPGNAAAIERPGTVAYDPGLASSAAVANNAGLADYPGFNFRGDGSAALSCISIVAGGNMGPYPLKPHSKYYLRAAGVTGVHDAVTSAISPMPQFYGYNITVDGLRLSYMDTANLRSACAGSLVLPNPSGFSLAFSELKLSPDGELSGATLGNPGIRRLAYWDTDMRVDAMSFDTSNACTSGNRTLALAGAALLPSITSEPLQGMIAVLPDGKLTNLAGTTANSRFTLPTSLTIKGRNNAGDDDTYTFTPVSPAMLSAWDASVPAGFVSMAGLMGVPFFEDLRVHIHASSSSAGGTDGSLFVMGGWTSDPSGDTGGWTLANGKNFFNDPNFDANGRGWPIGITLEQYRNSTTTQYHPRAVRNWRDIVSLNYPLQWSPLERTFASVDPSVVKVESQILIMNLEHKVEHLTTQGTEISFGAGFETPKLNVSSLAATLLEQNGSYQAIAGLLGTAMSPELLVKKLDDMELLVTNRVEQLIVPAVDGAINTAVDSAFAELQQAYNPILGFGNLNTSQFSNVNVKLTSDLMEAVGQSGVLAVKIQEALTKGIEACDAVSGLVHDRAKVRQAVQQLAALGNSVPAVADVTKFLDDAEPTLARCEKMIGEVRARLVSVRDGAQYVSRMTLAMQTGLDFNPDELFSKLTAQYKEELDVTRRFLSEFTPEQHKAKLKAFIQQYISGAKIMELIKPVLQGAFKEVRDQLRAAIDLVFGEISRILNRAIKGAVEAVSAEFTKLAGATGGTEGSIVKGVGDFASAARVDGYAQINGEEIALIRINANMKLQFGEGLQVDGYCEFRNVASGTPNTTCRAPGVVATEVAMGAHGVGKFGVTDIDCNMEGKFSFGDDMTLVGLDGSFSLKSNMKVKQVSLNEISAQFAIGGGECYMSGRVGAQVDFVSMEATCFFGTTRNPRALRLLDKETLRVINVNPTGDDCLDYSVTGIYTLAKGSASLNHFFRIPDSILLSIQASSTMGAYAFLENTGGDNFSLLAGVVYGIGIKMQLAAVITGEGSLNTAVGVEVPLGSAAYLLEHPAQLLNGLLDATATGTARLTITGKAGVDPFEVEATLEKTVTIVVTRGNGVQLSLD